MPCGTIAMIGDVAGRAIALHVARHGIRHAVRQVHAGVAEADARVRRRQQHVRARLVVRGVVDGAHQILIHHPQRLHRPDVADRVRPLIRRPHRRTIGHRPLGVRHRGERFDGVAQDVEPGRGRDLRRHRPRVVGIEIAERRLEPAVRDAGLRLQLLVVEDRHAGRLAPRPRRRRNRDQRLQRTRHRQALADRRVHVVEEVGGRIGRVEVDRLGRVDHGAAADGDERVERPLRSRTRWRRETTRRSARRARDRRARTRILFCSSDSSTVRTGGSFASSGSVTTITSFAPISARSCPTSRVTPTPKRTLETAISNAMSLVMESCHP